ncbi:MAG: sulfatase-like hydrolase/transferase, partial [Deltaproteobacteria bacterium]|nr:sulfatase-like hydrolase/transferase [Deltaproteobacteria bacterium]
MARLLIALAALAAPEPAPSPPRTNVVVFVIDTVRADRLGAYGGSPKTAPVFDRIASEHFVFESAYAPS